MEWRNGEGPNNTFVVMVLFDRRGGSPSDSDAVAAHDGEAFFALRIQERGLHEFTVFGAEHKDVSDFNAARRFQRPVFSR